MSSAPTVFMFAGQGSQHYQMGRELFDRQPVFRRWMLQLDATTRELTGTSVVQMLYAPERRRNQPFEAIHLTHPAIFMIEFALAQVLIDCNIRPSYTLGASLGIFAAAAVSGCIGPHEALAAVLKQASILATTCQPGGMIAVLGDPRLYQEPELAQNCDLAARNNARHFVIAACEPGLDRVQEYLASRDVVLRKIPVSYAFHSRWIDSAEQPCLAYLRKLSFVPARIPIICCAASTARERLEAPQFWAAARAPIEFERTITSLEQQGPHRYIDVGPSAVLATLLKYGPPLHPRSQAHPILTPFGHDLANLQRLSAADQSTRSSAAAT